MKAHASWLGKLVMVAVLLAALPHSGWAHPGHGTASGFSSGMLHPFTGWDHILAMVGVGLWAAQIGGRSRWLVPFCFVGAMTLGGIAGINGWQIPFVEQGIALSVLSLGLFIALAFKPAWWVPAVLVAFFAVFHGAAHGAEMPVNASGLMYSFGFVLATAMLHLCGIALGFMMQRMSTPVLVRVAGGATAAMGLYLLAV